MMAMMAIGWDKDFTCPENPNDSWSTPGKMWILAMVGEKQNIYIYNSYYSYLNFRDDLSNQFSEVVLYVGTKPTIVPRISQIEKTRG